MTTISKTMNAVVVRAPGGPEVLEYTQVCVPCAREGWSLVQVKGFGINHSEIFTRQGLSPSVEFPRILGIECVGEIAESTDAQRLPVGTRVCAIMGEMGRAYDGSYAQYCLLPNENIHPIHTALTWQDMAAVPETYYTAYLSLHNLQLEAGQHILVRGSTSGVGVAFIRLAHAAAKDLVVAGTTRNPEKIAQVLAAGFDQAVLDKDGHLETEEEFHRVLELIGPATMKDTCAHVAEGGIVCSTGQLGGKWYLDGFDPIEHLPRNGYLTSAHSANVDGKLLQELFNFIERHNIDVAPAKVFDLKHVAKAHAYLESAHSFGKLVVLNK